MKKAEPKDRHARAVVIESVNALIDTFLKKASRADVDTLAGALIEEVGRGKEG